MMRLQMKDSDQQIELVADSSLLLKDFLNNNGLMPRDGSLRYALDQHDNVINNLPLSETPSVMYLGLPERVMSIWVDRVLEDGVQTKTKMENGDEVFVPGLSTNEHYNLYISRITKSKSGIVRKNGYCFRTNGAAYQENDLVYVRIPISGDEISLFNPITGSNSIKIKLDQSTPLSKIRGLWCVCSYHSQSGLKAYLQYRPEHTFIPPSFKPIQREEKQPLKPKLAGLNRYRRRGKNPKPWGPGITIGRFKDWLTYIAGAPPSPKGTILGRRVRTFTDAHNNSAQLINSYRDGEKLFETGDTIHIQMPKSGDLSTIFNPISKKNDLQIKVHPPRAKKLSMFSKCWVITRVCKSQNNPDILNVVIDSTLSELHKSNFSRSSFS